MKPTLWLYLVVAIVAAASLVGLGVGVRQVLGQNKPISLALIDREILKRTESQLQTLQLRYQAEAAPIVKEHDDIVARYCAQAGVAVVDCLVDSASGVISKKPTQPKK